MPNLRTFRQNTESHRRDLRRAEYCDERHPNIAAFFEKIVPPGQPDRTASSLFVAQGRNNARVAYPDAEQIVEAVRGIGQLL